MDFEQGDTTQRRAFADANSPAHKTFAFTAILREAWLRRQRLEYSAASKELASTPAIRITC
jgi:hypothetical protein